MYNLGHRQRFDVTLTRGKDSTSTIFDAAGTAEGYSLLIESHEFLSEGGADGHHTIVLPGNMVRGLPDFSEAYLYMHVHGMKFKIATGMVRVEDGV